MNNQKILIVEDEPTVSRIVKSYFEKEGYEVFTVADGNEAIKIFTELKFDLICLDIMLPGINGFEILKIIRSSSSIPVIMMTALQDEESILKGYDLKVDDYITKPFNPKILVAKAKNLLVRANNQNQLKQDFTVENIRIVYSKRMVYVDDRLLDLSKTEFDLLLLLINNRENVCSREFILDEIWGLKSYVDDRIVDTYIKNLRKQIKPYEYIKTVFGIGYRFSVKDED